MLIEAQCEQCLFDKGKIRPVRVLLPLCEDQVFIGKIANDRFDFAAELAKRFNAPMPEGELVLPFYIGMGANKNRDDLFRGFETFTQLYEFRIGEAIEPILHKRTVNDFWIQLDNGFTRLKL